MVKKIDVNLLVLRSNFMPYDKTLVMLVFLSLAN